MQAPRDLGLTSDYHLCEYGTNECASLFRRKGQEITPQDDLKYGVTMYLAKMERAKMLADARAMQAAAAPEAKAVDKTEVEDKSVKGPTEAKAEPSASAREPADDSGTQESRRPRGR